MSPKITLINSKSVFTKSGLPGSDWVVNPYNGCLFCCAYCYAAPIARWKHPDEEWGTFLDVKINAPEVLKKELIKLEKKSKAKDFGSVLFSSVTDPYPGLEIKYRLTRGCLEALVDFGYEGDIGIQTKSPLVTRDIDILKKLKNVSVGFTITTLDDKVSRFLETHAPPTSARLDAMKKLHNAGIRIYAFVGPILPYFVAREADLVKILDKLEEVGISEVWFEHMNFSWQVKERLYRVLRERNPAFVPYFDKANSEAYRARTEKIVNKIMKGRKLKLGLGKVIDHKKLVKK